MQKTKIEWCDYVANPVKGVCQHQCPYCYAKRLYQRFKWSPEVRFDESAFDGIEKLKPGSKIFIGSTHDIFGDWIPDDWIISIIMKAGHYPHLTFIFLTKNPKRYSNFMFHPNIWIGYSTTGPLYHEWDYKHKGNIKFISIEPMMGELVNTSYLHDTNWVIIGAESGNRKEKVKLDKRWVLNAMELLYEEDIPFFIKNNADGCKGIQDYPYLISEAL